MSIGTLEYNGYTFGEHSHVDVSTEMVYDDSQRAVVYHRHTINVSAIITAEGGYADSGAHVETIRKKLSKPGQRLKLSAKGFGPALDVNTLGSSAIVDVAFGPLPKVISWKPVGHTESAEITWQCVVTIPECGDAVYKGLATINYSIVFDINERGFTTRTVSGYLEIAMTRKLQSDGEGTVTGLNQMEDTADAYRDQIVVPKPINFARRQSWNISADKRRADFTIVDSEIESPNAWPAGVTNIEANHRARASGRSRATVLNSLTASIELAQDQKRVLAWEIFKAIINRRIARSIAAGLTVMFEDLEIDESLFSNTIRFSFTYRVIGEELHKILSVLGLMESLAYDWQSWSLNQATLEDNRGWAQLKHRAVDDQLISLCDSGEVTASDNSSTVVQPYPSSMPTICNPLPPPEKSYVHYEAVLIEETDSRSFFTHTLGPVEVKNNNFDISDPLATVGGVDADTVETAVAESMPGQRWRWKGYVERLGYPIPTPDILTIGGVTLKKVGVGKVARKDKGIYFCQPLYAAAFNILYQVTARPAVADGGLDDPTENPVA